MISQDESSHYRAKLSVAPSGERWALVEDKHGIPHDDSTVYAAMSLREAGLSFNSQLQQLAAIAMALNWAEAKRICLEQRIGSCDLLDRSEIFDLRRELRRNCNLDKAKTAAAKKLIPETVAQSTYYNRVHFVCAYIVWLTQNVITRIPARDPERAKEARIRLERFQKMMLDHLPHGKVGERKALTEEQEKAFLAAIKPGSPSNPFKPYLQRRNHALMLLYDLLGARRAELLKVKTGDLVLSGPSPRIDIVVRNDEKNDKRKNEPRAKTNGRPLPLGPALVQALRDYILYERSQVPGSKKEEFLFLARDGKPLALQTVNDMFRRLRKCVPELPDDFTTHPLRHTANERFSVYADEQGWNEAEELQARNFTFGWGKTSKQGEKYLLRRTRQKASEASLRMQEKSLNGE